jgi:hypothetical protein
VFVEERGIYRTVSSLYNIFTFFVGCVLFLGFSAAHRLYSMLTRTISHILSSYGVLCHSNELMTGDIRAPEEKARGITIEAAHVE